MQLLPCIERETNGNRINKKKRNHCIDVKISDYFTITHINCTDTRIARIRTQIHKFSLRK